MAKKTATYGGYELRVEDNGKIVILNGGQPVPNAMGTIRSIAAEVGFTLDPKWNTQSSGRKLVDFINNAVAAPKQEQRPTPEPEVKKASAPAPEPDVKEKAIPAPKSETEASTEHNENELTEEEMEELLKHIAELRKTIEALEARIGKLEKSNGSSSSAVNTPDKIVVDKYYGLSSVWKEHTEEGIKKFDRNAVKTAYDYWSRDFSSNPLKLKEHLLSFITNVKRHYATNSFSYTYELGGYACDKLNPDIYRINHHFVLLSDGKMYTTSRVGNDLNALKPIAAGLGMDIPKGTRAENIASELVFKYGDGKSAVIGNKIVHANGVVNQLDSEKSYRNILQSIKRVQEEILKYNNETIPLNVKDTYDVKENLEAISEYFDGLQPKIKAQPAAAQAEEFERVAKEVFKELGVDL